MCDPSLRILLLKHSHQCFSIYDSVDLAANLGNKVLRDFIHPFLCYTAEGIGLGK